jgi:polysaccharide biosynthesis/export protein
LLVEGAIMVRLRSFRVPVSRPAPGRGKAAQAIRVILLALTAWAAAFQPAIAALHPGDILDIVIFDHPELSGPATVSKDGFVSVPLIGRVRAAGAEPDGLADRIRLGLGKYLPEPAVDVHLRHVAAARATMAHVVVARPEVSSANVVHVGQTLVIPLYDGAIATPPDGYANLRRIGGVRIRKHDLSADLGGRSFFGGYDASSDRGVAFIVERRGAGSINVLLRLPQLKERCVSCRTLHFFYHAT